jgi:hypothetical protein
MSPDSPTTEDLLSKLIEQHLTVSGLVRNVVRDLDIRTIGDLCNLDINVVANLKGVGVKKVDEVRRLVERARQLAKISRSKEIEPSANLTKAVVGAGEILVFIPSILKLAFEQLGIDTVEKLLSLDLAQLDQLPGWGDRKKAAARGTKTLYARLAAHQPNGSVHLVGDLVPAEILPSAAVGETLLEDFLAGRNGDTLRGKSLLEANNLRILLSPVLETGSGNPQVEELEWRDVPLQVSARVETIADKYKLVSVQQIAEFAMHGRAVDPVTNIQVDVTRENNFGDSSLISLREEIHKLRTLGLDNYQRQFSCCLGDLDCADEAWRDVPLRINRRTRELLRHQGLVTIREVHRFALRKQVFRHDQDRWISVHEFSNFSEGSIHELRSELSKLAKAGLERYRFGKSGSPKTLAECIVRALGELEPRQLEIVRSRCSGATWDETAQQHQLTRERARQIAKAAFGKLYVYRSITGNLLSKSIAVFPPGLHWKSEEIQNLLNLELPWHLDFLLQLADMGLERLNATMVSRIPAKCIEVLRECLRKLTEADDAFPLRHVSVIGEVIEAFSTAFPDKLATVGAVDDYSDSELTRDDIRCLLGDNWLRASVRSQIVDAGVNGVAFADIDTSGVISDPNALAELLGTQAVRLKGDVFRRPGEVYERADEIIEIVRSASGEVDVEYIMSRSTRKWHQAPLVGNYLSRLFEIVSTSRGGYIHIEKLNLTVAEVKLIANWGSELLAGEKRAIDGNELFDLFKSSPTPQKITNAYQLVSVLAKHSEIRRLSNNLQLAHRASFDESELSLAKADPEIAGQWHPTKNGSVTPAHVRPNSFKKRWWRCEKGHEFEAMPVYRTRMYRECIGCQPRWTLSKIRVFVASLREHLNSFTAAELYVIFQQSGLLRTGGQARGFVRSLATGRFPGDELDKFVAGNESLVDHFLNDSKLELKNMEVHAQVRDEEIPSVSSALDHDEAGSDSKPERLPTVNSKAALRALDCAVLASTDAEAVDFLVASAKAKVWSHAYRDSETAVREVLAFGESDYAQRVREEFLTEFSEASGLQLPPGYSFRIGTELILPNLMQRHVAIEVFKRKRFGNWSGTGAGKTLSAILASRVCGASLTIVWCPNSTVGDFQSGWSGEIGRIFSDSDIAVKTWNPQWQHSSQHRYLVMNYEQLQQKESERQLKQFLEESYVDLIVIDEVHFAKQRYADQLSQRKRLLQAMVSEAGKKNAELRVLGMSATPVINNLQEGRSLIEMITGIEHNDLPIKPTVPNCMRLHQQLARLGTRWRPDYEPSLVVETPEVDCGESLDEIRELGRHASPLEIEKVLTQARIPSILEVLRRPGRSLIYTHYVDEIAAALYKSVSEAGYRVGLFTGDSKQGLEGFRSGELDVLIGSSSIGTGVDGLQLVCDRLIINCLPWTNAEFEQLIGRIWRQGQLSKKVEVIVPLTYAMVNGVKWSYCQSKYQRIQYKKSISDAAVDGAVPDGNLRSAAQAQSDVLAWLQRLETGEELTVQRRSIVVPLNDGGAAAENRLARYGEFSTMNARWNSANSGKTHERLRANPEEWEQYHTLYRKARESWNIVPYEEFIRWCISREGYIIADFGCGEALVARAVSERHTVYSFDHIAIDESVVAGDMSSTSLDSESVDVALFSLSLMGSNFTDYLREAYRVLKIDGQIHIWESASRFDDVRRFSQSLEKLGFQVFEPKNKDTFVLIEGRKTERPIDESIELRFRM